MGQADETWQRYLEMVEGEPPTISALRSNLGWMGSEVERMLTGLRAVGMAEG